MGQGLEHGPWVGGCAGGGGGLLGWVSPCERPLENRAKPKGGVLWAVTCQRPLQQGWGFVVGAPRWCWDLQKELGGLDLWKKGCAEERKSGHGGRGLLH